LAQVRRLGNPPDFYDYEKEPPTRGSAVACAIASDWHVEEPVIASKVNGLNEYSLEIARARAERFFQNTLILTDIMARDSDIQILYLMFLGDFFTNYLLPEMMQTNELPPEEAARFAQGLLADGIRFLLRNSRYKLEIDCIAGNHGRMTPKMQVSNATGTSLETFMYHALAGLFHDEPRVTFRIANSKMLYRRFFEKFTLRLIHGDDIRYQGGIGGVTIPLRKKIAQWDKSIRAHLTCLGHFHQRQDGGDFIVNGSLIGYNEFAQTIGASPEAPVQSFFLIHNRNGGEKSITAPIWVDR
jgi:hypothetical protein